MKRFFLRYAAAWLLILPLMVGNSALAQKQGGILKLYSPASPASMSLFEEVTIVAEMPIMGVFNNLIMFDQHVPQVSLQSIVPDLATSWSWNEDGTELSFKLRQGVKWHDGKPFTARDIKCSWDLRMDEAPEKLRTNPQKSAFSNLAAVTTEGDFGVTFHLKRPQPSFPMILANGFTVIFPCHVPPNEMRQHPIGTGPFKFVEFKPNESIKVARNPDYWKPERPFLDGIEYAIISNPSTATLAFISGKFDMTFPFALTPPLLNNVQSQVPEANCELSPGSVNTHLLVNRDKPPFNNPELRRAMALAIDRQAFIDTLSHGHGEIGGIFQPPPGGLWGMLREEIVKLPGYAPDVQNSRKEARWIMEKLGYGPDHRLALKVTTRDWSIYRDPAVLLIDQLNGASAKLTVTFPDLAR